MKTDLYTKIVLTAIALGIFILIFQNAGVAPVTTAQAAAIPAPAPQAVHSPLEVNVVQWGGVELNESGVSKTEHMSSIAVKSY
ncbi:hypothetical protein [Dysgonomonas massiliensis]|uniref:hypothetical protein n=1 Tax=Dysgonomonas massiliensis TaxID=2040292 RepID=UPI000C76C870|nr:hypothetical protein [Dysgonomonas massiliensis]